MTNKVNTKMKKLVIAVAMIAVSAVVNAASFSWTTSGLASTKNIYASDATTLLYAANSSAMIYLFDTDVISQADLLSGLREGNAITDYSSVASQSIASNSRITTQAVSYGTAGNEYKFYVAIVNGDEVFLGANSTAAAQASDTAFIYSNGMGSATKVQFADSETEFGTAGWYSTTAVPEPTSGLLLLLGMAGLALKRKQA